MTPKNKARELVEKMRLQMPPTIIPTASTSINQLSCDFNLKGSTANAKLCALIAVNEILDASPMYYTGFEYESNLEYWQQVKTEIKKL